MERKCVPGIVPVTIAKATGVHPAEFVVVHLIRMRALIVQVVMNKLFAIKVRGGIFRYFFVSLFEVEPENI
jgi:hypothetical protein